jgi:type II secretory pathway component PulC
MPSTLDNVSAAGLLCEKVAPAQRKRVKQPFWIVNSSLLLFLLLVGFFVFFSRVRLPRRVPISVEYHAHGKTKEEFEINIQKIYENDLFDTFHREVPVYQQPMYKLDIPPAPPMQEPIIPKVPEPTFLEPLNITLKGIIVVSHDERKNRVIIADNKTDREQTYKTGDTIDDAQIIRIFNNKVLFLRSNGQQEVLYLKEYDAKHDPAYAMLDDWHDVIRPTAPFYYEISPRALVERIETLSQFIDALGLSTAYEKGVSVGCHIGNLTAHSLGINLGFSAGDVVTSVNGIPATTTQNRLEIYKLVTHLPENGIIKVQVQRRGMPMQLQFTLREFNVGPATGSVEVLTVPSKEQELEYKKELLKKKHKFAPTIKELQHQERELVLKHRKKD